MRVMRMMVPLALVLVLVLAATATYAAYGGSSRSSCGCGCTHQGPCTATCGCTHPATCGCKHEASCGCGCTHQGPCTATCGCTHPATCACHQAKPKTCGCTYRSSWPCGQLCETKTVERCGCTCQHVGPCTAACGCQHEMKCECHQVQIRTNMRMEAVIMGPMGFQLIGSKPMMKRHCAMMDAEGTLLDRCRALPNHEGATEAHCALLHGPGTWAGRCVVLRSMLRAKTRGLWAGEAVMTSLPMGLMLTVSDASHHGDPNASVDVHGKGCDKGVSLKAVRVGPGIFRICGDLVGIDAVYVRVVTPGAGVQNVWFNLCPIMDHRGNHLTAGNCACGEAVHRPKCACGDACKCAQGDHSACKCGATCKCATPSTCTCGGH